MTSRYGPADRQRSMADRHWELFGYALWVVGCVLFALAALDNDDWRSFAASTLFLVGVLAVMVPISRRSRRDQG